MIFCKFILYRISTYYLKINRIFLFFARYYNISVWFHLRTIGKTNLKYQSPKNLIFLLFELLNKIIYLKKLVLYQIFNLIINSYIFQYVQHTYFYQFILMVKILLFIIFLLKLLKCYIFRSNNIIFNLKLKFVYFSRFCIIDRIIMLCEKYIIYNIRVLDLVCIMYHSKASKLYIYNKYISTI